MATQFLERKKGKGAYQINVYHNGKRYTSTWNIPDGWSKSAVQRGLKKAETDFIAAVRAGEVVTLKEKKEIAKQAEIEQTQILTLQRYAEEVFMPAKSITIAEHTRESYQGNLRIHIYPALGEMKITEIKAVNINALFLGMQKNGSKLGTAIKVYHILSGLFKMAYLEETIPENPMDKVTRPRATKAEKVNKGIEAYTKEEIRRFRECADNEPLKWRALAYLLTDTGCRIGEALGVTWKHVDFAKHRVRFEDNLCYTPTRGTYIDTIKNGNARTNEVSATTIELLRQVKAEQAQYGTHTNYVFTQDPNGEPMHHDSPRDYFGKFGARYGFENCHPHKLRHSFISIAVTSGADIASIAAIVGDKIETILKYYTHANEESKAAATRIYLDAIGGD